VTDGDDRHGRDDIRGRDDGHEPADETTARDEHLDDLPDGSGCTEIWEHMADHRGREATDAGESHGGEEAGADD